ncbi:MAG: bifunctional proline dehydrogenase/L-glutamate gamma-semialdehyde dehydrogenase, partial [Oceanospirillaceae bacterium]|nr:bifunctional proline dehydrogenase/L-glutamate gamma-semialdehyde dehydrogenase [Oceanospirillaceae bacterium]
NRNQIGAIVGSQPFGGEGLSGTGPKAGGPMYVRRFMTAGAAGATELSGPATVDAEQLQRAIDRLDNQVWIREQNRAQRLQPIFGAVPAALDAKPEELPGPTGELNVLRCCPRGLVICLGPDLDTALKQAGVALSQGNAAVVVAPGADTALSAAGETGIPVIGIDGLLQPEALESLTGFEAVVSSAPEATLRQYRVALSRRDGALLPLLNGQDGAERYVIERHLCVDTTAAGGNASLIAASE